MYTTEILWFLSLPVLIYVTYRIILCGVKKIEKTLGE